MKLGNESSFIFLKFEEALKYLNSIGVDCIEIGAGGFPETNI